ncbi:FeoB-associated Cys-rich membrane protein [Clostridium niameyense]|uniref:FeoB-associated Cys-rich membrane protein n=1 Tax=Clostridium niameyense TaxID=1622073 RepID=A0A6M0RCQ8_9CLOT|nr:FeoB-associated Cys-rich membrane protein [Clostridium niameyense]NEZ46948.1 FeoB-associated Cys-rich membrane protein [Clostridium niameyense]
MISQIIITILIIALATFLLVRSFKKKTAGQCDCSSCSGNCGCCSSNSKDTTNKKSALK